MMRSHTISVAIRYDVREAYVYLSDPQNIPAWAPGLCTAVERAGEDWIATTPQGPLRVRFVGQNALGVLDHYVRAEPEAEVLNRCGWSPTGAGAI